MLIEDLEQFMENYSEAMNVDVIKIRLDKSDQ